MKNRAKCKLCQSIIESYHRTDYVSCTCSQIAVYGGPDLMQCSAIDWANFLRVDDNNNEIAVKIREPGATFETKSDQTTSKTSRADLIYILDEMIASIDKLPQSAMTAPITNIEYQTLLCLLSAYFKSFAV